MPLPAPLALILSLSLAAPPPAPEAASTPAPSDPTLARLAAEAPQPEWVAEGGSAAHAKTTDVVDARKKMRRAARTTIAGGALAVLGLTAGVAGVFTLSVPKQQLDELKQKNDGSLPTDDPKRQRAITLAQVSPALIGAGAGLLVVGAIMVGVAGKRFKKMHEEQRTSTVAFAPVGMRRGAGFAVGVRF
jgi:hypothetical protein